MKMLRLNFLLYRTFYCVLKPNEYNIQCINNGLNCEGLMVFNGTWSNYKQ